MIAQDFSTRLSAFDRWRRKVYARGFWHGAVLATAGVLFFAWYWSVGGQS